MMLQRLLEELGPWLWWIVGLLLIGLEVLVPGTFFLWFGLAALMVGTLAVLVELPWQVEIGLFALFSLASLVIGRQVMRGNEQEEGEELLNRRGARFVGQVHVLSEPIAGGNGRLALDDSVWRVSGPDQPAGARVRIVGLDGSTLLVEPADG